MKIIVISHHFQSICHIITIIIGINLIGIKLLLYYCSIFLQVISAKLTNCDRNEFTFLCFMEFKKLPHFLHAQN
jgi:hypothetical protein